MQSVTIQFDPNQEHQLTAVESVVKLFDGLSPYYTEANQLDEIVPNLPPYCSLDSGWLLDNLQTIQRERSLPESMFVQTDSGYMVDGVSLDTWEYPSFTVDMETGTGKTYVYLRTIHELRARYGFRKFIIVVPSIAIYEGVVNAFASTREHFKGLYGNENVSLIQYDGNVQDFKNFATSSFVEILLITVDSFNRKSNIAFKQTDKLIGERLPYEFIQETRPILILDECQNYRSEKSRAALRTLKPLFAVNYSATPGKDATNLVHKLTPFDAFKKNLVKRIEVLGMVEAQSTAQRADYLKLISIDYGPVARLQAMALAKGVLQDQEFTLGAKANLAEKTANDAYAGWLVETIDKAEGYVSFTNGERLYLEDERYAAERKEALFRRQIEETIQAHFDKQRELRDYGVKVLSLFFIDRVASYRDDDGIVKRLFDEAFDRLKSQDPQFAPLRASDVREAYFAKKKVKGIEEEIDTSFEEADKKSDEKEAEKRAYELIMQRKEKLLSFDEPVSFIFAHSAIREGWDNPNVFQICALREITSEKERRQTIGRGLRLPVTQAGLRITDRRLNVLTVVANDSYANYVARLQREYEDTGDVMPQVPADKSKKERATRNDVIFQSRDFQNFWNRLIQKTEYVIKIDKDEFVRQASGRLNNTIFPEPHLIITKGDYVITNYRLDLLEIQGRVAKIRIRSDSTSGDRSDEEHFFKEGADLAKLLLNPVFKPFKITAIRGNDETGIVEFSETDSLSMDHALQFSTERGQVFSTMTVSERVTHLPKFNLIDRVSKELSLTRATVLDVFKALSDSKKQAFMENPEGFSGVFIDTLRETLADHLTERLSYLVTEEIDERDIELAFPPTKEYPVKELVAGHADRSLYDFVQKDSENEERFIHRLNDGTDDKVILYFKFPPTFKIRIPKIIGNYNPDWGILRWNEQHRLKLELVRETKGQLDLDALHFTNEGRKVRCAQKHFAALGMSYRHITGDTTDWWKEEG